MYAFNDRQWIGCQIDHIDESMKCVNKQVLGLVVEVQKYVCAHLVECMGAYPMIIRMIKSYQTYREPCDQRLSLQGGYLPHGI